MLVTENIVNSTVKNVKVKRRYDIENGETMVKRRRNPVWGGGHYILKIEPPITPLIHVD